MELMQAGPALRVATFDVTALHLSIDLEPGLIIRLAVNIKTKFSHYGSSSFCFDSIQSCLWSSRSRPVG